MSPLKANVLINGCINTISMSVGNTPENSSSRRLTVYLVNSELGVKPIKLGEYVVARVIGAAHKYHLFRWSDSQPTFLNSYSTLLECQVVALSDFIQISGLQLVSD